MQLGQLPDKINLTPDCGKMIEMWKSFMYAQHGNQFKTYRYAYCILQGGN